MLSSLRFDILNIVALINDNGIRLPPNQIFSITVQDIVVDEYITAILKLWRCFGIYNLDVRQRVCLVYLIFPVV